MTLTDKIQAALNAAIENPSKENIEAYKNLLEMQKVQESQAAVKAPVEENKKTVDPRFANLSESTRTWATKMMDAIAVGTAYTSLVPGEVASEIEKKVETYGQFRRLCTVHKCSGNYSFAVEDDIASVYYTAEGAGYTESTPTVAPVELNAYKLTCLVKLSREAIADPVVNFVEYVTYAIGKAIAKKEDHEILLGAGVNATSGVYNITGILTALKAQASTPQIITDTTAAGAFSWATLKSVFNKIGQNRTGASIVMTQATCDYIHEFKDSGKYIFDQNQPLTTIWGMGIIISTDMDEIGDGKYPVLVGNFSKYHLADRQDLEMRTLNELYATNGQVGVIADKRVDGKPSQLGAFAALKLDF